MSNNKSVIDCNLIVDDDFMNKDVSDLVSGDFYLFCVKDNKTYLYKDGHIGVAYFDSCGEESINSVEYSKGTLQEYVDNLGGRLAMRLCIDHDFSLSAMFTREARLDTLNLHIYLGKKEGKYVEDLIKLREARYLI